jgi:hypothetical protein
MMRKEPMTELASVYVITMWSGGRPSRKWKALQKPTSLPQGTGVTFTCLETGLGVDLIGSISIEEYEAGSIALEIEMQSAMGVHRESEPDEAPQA